MKKFLSIFLIFLLYSLGQTVKAQVISTSTLIPMIESAESKEIRAKGYNDIQVKVVSIPMENVSLPEGNISVIIHSSNSHLVGREYKKVDIYVNSKYQRSIGVPVETKIFQNILVAKEPITKDSILTTQNIEVQRQNILALTQNAWEEKALSSEIIATKMYRTGEIIDKRFSKIKPDVVKNAQVTVVFKTDDEMAITVEGIALVEGSIGSFISVQNKTYNKVYMGKVIGTNRVLVEI